MSRQPRVGEAETEPGDNPQSSGSALPRQYSPRVAGYAPGPFLTPTLVTPSDWRWRNARSYTITVADGNEYRAIRVSSGREFVGYWAVELLGEQP